MTWTEFSEELWERMGQGTGILDKETHAWAVEQYRKLQRWNEEVRGERDEARRLTEDFAEQLAITRAAASGMAAIVPRVPWKDYVADPGHEKEWGEG